MGFASEQKGEGKPWGLARRVGVSGLQSSFRPNTDKLNPMVSPLFSLYGFFACYIKPKYLHYGKQLLQDGMQKRLLVHVAWLASHWMLA